MERTKRQLYDVGKRQLRRRIASEVQGALQSDMVEFNPRREEQDLQLSYEETGTTGSRDHESDSPIETQLPNNFQVSGASGEYDSDISFEEFEEEPPSEQDGEVESPYDALNQVGMLPSLPSQLRDWALCTNVCASHLSGLLKILRAYHPELPADARTLMRTV